MSLRPLCAALFSSILIGLAGCNLPLQADSASGGRDGLRRRPSAEAPPAAAAAFPRPARPGSEDRIEKTLDEVARLLGQLQAWGETPPPPPDGLLPARRVAYPAPPGAAAAAARRPPASAGARGGDTLEKTLGEIEEILAKIRAERRPAPAGWPPEAERASAPPAPARETAPPARTSEAAAPSPAGATPSNGAPPRPAEGSGPRTAAARTRPPAEAAPGTPLREVRLVPPARNPLAEILSAALTPLAVALQGRTPASAGSAALSSLRSATSVAAPYIGERLPEWTKRIEVDIDVQRDDKPIFSILTVQPLYQRYDKVDTVFTQLRGDKSSQSNWTFNAGLGYRRTLLENTVLAGVNGFFDVDQDDNRRLGTGAELKWNAFDFTFNYYWGVTDRHTVSGLLVEPLDGYDFEIMAQIPYLPWARVYASRFFFDGKRAKNLKGFQVSAELDLHPNFQLEFGYRDEMDRDQSLFANFRIRVGASRRPTASHVQWVDSVPFRPRDMRDQTLVKVRRENTVITESTKTTVTGSVVITRNN